MSFSVKLTREEYMDFCVRSRRKTVWFAVFGALLFLVAVASHFLEGGTVSFNWLLMFVGAICLTADTLWLPLYEKGAAGKRYDASDALSGAVAVTVSEETVTVKSAVYEATLPLSLISEVRKTADMAAWHFGRELVVYIPRRAVSDAEWASVCNR